MPLLLPVRSASRRAGHDDDRLKIELDAVAIFAIDAATVVDDSSLQGFEGMDAGLPGKQQRRRAQRPGVVAGGEYRPAGRSSHIDVHHRTPFALSNAWGQHSDRAVRRTRLNCISRITGTLGTAAA